MTEQELAAKADGLTASVDNLTTSVKALQDTVREQGILQRRLKVGFWTLAGVVVALIVVGALALTANSTAQQNKETARITCEASNESRATSRQLWLFILDGAVADPTNPPTAVQRKQIAIFRDRVIRSYAPRECGSDTPTNTSPSPSR